MNRRHISMLLATGIALPALANLHLVDATTQAQHTAENDAHPDPRQGRPAVVPVISGSRKDNGIRLVMVSPSPTTTLVGEYFAAEVTDLVGSTPVKAAETRTRLTELWNRHIAADRELRSPEATALDKLNQQALAAINEDPIQNRESATARFLMAAASTASAQIARGRQAVHLIAEAVSNSGVDPTRLASAVQFAQGLVALQQGYALVNGNALPAADVDLFTDINGMLNRLQARGITCTDAELAPLREVLRAYVLAVGPLQAARLDAAAAVGARGNEPGALTAPPTERRRASDLAWRVFLAQLEWMPRILDAIPQQLRDYAEPELFATVAPEQFPDTESMWPVIAAYAAKHEQPNERAEAIANLASWFRSVYPETCRELIHAYAEERKLMFGLARRPPESKTIAAVDSAMAKRTNINAMADLYLRSIDPEFDVEGERQRATMDAMRLEGMILGKRLERLGRPMLP